MGRRPFPVAFRSRRSRPLASLTPAGNWGGELDGLQPGISRRHSLGRGCPIGSVIPANEAGKTRIRAARPPQNVIPAKAGIHANASASRKLSRRGRLVTAASAGGRARSTDECVAPRNWPTNRAAAVDRLKGEPMTTDEPGRWLGPNSASVVRRESARVEVETGLRVGMERWVKASIGALPQTPQRGALAAPFEPPAIVSSIASGCHPPHPPYELFWWRDGGVGVTPGLLCCGSARLGPEVAMLSGCHPP
jgi:hypothetical protein